MGGGARLRVLLCGYGGVGQATGPALFLFFVREERSAVRNVGCALRTILDDRLRTGSQIQLGNRGMAGCASLSRPTGYGLIVNNGRKLHGDGFMKGGFQIMNHQFNPSNYVLRKILINLLEISFFVFTKRIFIKKNEDVYY